VENIKEEAASLLRAGAARTVRDGRELTERVDAWLLDPQAREEVGRNAGNAVAALRGGTERALSWLVERGVLAKLGGTGGS
jgi:3-deoxy-D-manno-octulosonic-acid transferase